MGYPALLRVLEEEAVREARELRAAAVREAARVVAEAGEAARVTRGAVVARERAAQEARRRVARESLAMDRDRALLGERRRLLAELQAEVLRRAPSAAPPELDARLLAELLPEVGEGPLEVVVDPGAEGAARAALERLAPEVARRTRVRAAPARRGGVEVIAGRRVLDDSLPARVERAWPELEAELAAILFEET